MNVWILGATVSLLGFVPLLVVVMRASRTEALVAMQSAQALAVMVLLLLGQGFDRAAYFDVPLALAVLSFIGTLLFARFMEKGL